MPPRKARPDRFEQNALGFLDTTAEAAFASDERHRIVVWNQAAARLLGAEAADVVGKRCYDVVRGTDLFGNRFCSESCPLRKMDRRHEPIHAFQLQVRNGSGEKLKVECSIVVVPGPRPGGHSLIHLLLPADRKSHAQNIEQPRPDPASSEVAPEPDLGEKPSSCCPRPLTPREVEILRLVASGTDSARIAGLLSISVVTVRNHIQHILYKLEVHSKLQAVFVARRCKMI